MADDSFDADLEEAIRRSLADQGASSSDPSKSQDVNITKTTKPKQRIDVIVIEDDEGDAEDTKPINIVMKQSHAENIIPKTQSNMLSLDRAQMERERLARLKRKQQDDPTPIPLSKSVRSLATPKPIQMTNSTSSSAGGSLQNRFATLRDLKETVANYVSRTPQYFEGVVRKTYVQGRERTQDDIKLEEILQVATLQSAVLSAYVWDFLWVLQKIKVGECDLVFVLHAQEDQVDHFRRNLCNIPRTRLCFPDMTGNINCMHSKLQLLFHLTYLRVVVPTANLTPYDWGEALGTSQEGIMENSVFIIDFPELPKIVIAESPNSTHTHFSKQLLQFCKAKGLPADIIEKVERNYDFTKSKRLGFVYSAGGSHYGQDALRNGVCGLATAVKDLGLNTRKPIEIDYVTSSVGSLNKDFLLRMFRAFHGDDGRNFIKGIPKVNSRQLVDLKDESTESESDEDESEDKFWLNIRQSFRIYFPSRRTVAASNGGIENGGTICFQQKWFNSNTFPSSLLHDCRSVRQGILMHNKIIFVRMSRPRADALAWAYIGSANLSESAWGRLVWDRSQKTFKMSNRNWECGVIMPVGLPGGHEHKASTKDELSLPDIDVFTNVVPVPMSIPAPLLTTDNPPWFFGELRENP